MKITISGTVETYDKNGVLVKEGGNIDFLVNRNKEIELPKSTLFVKTENDIEKAMQRYVSRLTKEYFDVSLAESSKWYNSSIVYHQPSGELHYMYFVTVTHNEQKIEFPDYYISENNVG